MENMQNNAADLWQDTFVESPSGFMMPFPGDAAHDVDVTLGFGEQTHPRTGEPFFHDGVDFALAHQPLFAVASGVVVGIGNDAEHEDFLVIRHGDYEMKYGHISQAAVNYGAKVQAGQQVATSGDYLYIGTKRKGQPINPIDFLGRIYANVMQLTAMGIKGKPQFADLGVTPKTSYENDIEEIMAIMARWLPIYLNDIRVGAYQPGPSMEQGLKDTFGRFRDENYLFERIPTPRNPLGLTQRAAPMAGQMMDVLIRDFLGYMATRHDTYPPSWSDEQKKNLRSEPLPTAR